MGPGDGDDKKKVPNTDATYVAPPVQTYNVFSSPEGGILKLPITAKVESFFNEAPATANGIDIHPINGSVWTFSYKNETYDAIFNYKGEFTQYQSINDPSHILSTSINTTPKVDPKSSQKENLAMIVPVAIAGLSQIRT